MSCSLSRADAPAAVAAPRFRAASAALAAVCGAVLCQAYFGVNQDTSWLIEVAARTLDGAVPYRDLMEPNPPASFLIEMPAVLLGHALDVSAEAATVALVMLGAGASALLTGAILRRAGLLDRARASALLAAGAAVLLLLPMQSFAQREHVAVLAALPTLAAICARLRGRPPRLADAVAAGLGAGITIAIKPVFLPGLLLPAALLLAAPGRARLLRSPELWTAVAVVLAYGLVVSAVYPEYASRMLPLVTSIYLPARMPWSALLLLPCVLSWAVIALTAWRCGAWTDPLGRVLALSSAGFEIAGLVQGKGFAYHFLPALMMGTLACMVAALCRETVALRGNATALAIAVFLAEALLFGAQGSTASQAPGLAAAVKAISPAPRLLLIGADLRFGRMFAHEVGGVWVGSSPSGWVSLYSERLDPDSEHSPRFAPAIEAERNTLADDVARGRPDAVLIQGDAWQRWALRGTRLATALSGYGPVGQFGSIILLRASNAGARGTPP